LSAKYGMTYGGGVVFVDRGGTARKRIPKGFTVDPLEEYTRLIVASKAPALAP